VHWGWELVWFMVILKLPIVYLACVVWWAVRGKPEPLEPAIAVGVHEPLLDQSPGRRFARRAHRPRSGPHGSPRRAPARRAHATATAEKR